MGKPTLRRYKPGELGGIPIRVIDFGVPVVLASSRLQKPINFAGTEVSMGNVQGAYGAFFPGQNKIVLTKDIFTRQTVTHESGHAVDWKKGWESEKADSIFRTGGKNSPDKEWNQVLVHRFNRYVADSDQIKQFAALKRRLAPDYLGYMNSGHERFAESYSQWKTSPSTFKTYAPTIYKWFVKNAKGL